MCVDWKKAKDALIGVIAIECRIFQLRTWYWNFKQAACTTFYSLVCKNLLSSVGKSLFLEVGVGFTGIWWKTLASEDWNFCEISDGISDEISDENSDPSSELCWETSVLCRETSEDSLELWWKTLASKDWNFCEISDGISDENSDPSSELCWETLCRETS